MAIDGGVVSEMTLTPNGVSFPAASMARTLMKFEPAVSAALQVKDEAPTVAGRPLHVTLVIPERGSETEPLTFAVVAPRALPSTGAAMATDGALLSMLTRTFFVAVLPA